MNEYKKCQKNVFFVFYAFFVFFVAAGLLKLSDDGLTVTGEKGYSMIRATHGE